MATKLYCANVLIGDSNNPIIIEKVAIKKLPVHLLIADAEFRSKVIKWCGSEKEFENLPKNKKTNFPNIRIVYLKFINIINNEPLIGETL